MKASRITLPGDPTAWTAAAVVLAPYATVAFGYRRALVVQAVTILACVLVLLVVGLTRGRGTRALRLTPGPLVQGAVLYGLAALTGTIAALLRANEPTLVSGQLLSMGLLPLAAAAAALAAGPSSHRLGAGAIVGAAVLVSAIHFAYGALLAVRGVDLGRLALPNAIGATGVAMLAMLLALEVGAGQTGGRRVLVWAGGAAVALYTVIASARSLWLAVPVGLAVYAPLAYGRRRLFNRRRLRATAWWVGAAAACAALVAVWWWTPRTNRLAQLPQSAPTAAGAVVVAGPWRPGAGTFRITVHVRYSSPGTVTVDVQRRAATAGWESTERRVLLAPGRSDRRFDRVFWAERPADEVRIVVADARHLVRDASPTRLERLGPPWLGPLVEGVRARLFREPDPGFVAGETFARDASVAFRIKESEAVLRAFAAGSWVQRVFGAGLGARVPFETIGYDNEGRVGRISNPNYIHNFYSFLLFKLGLLGALAVLAALTLWVAGLARAALALPPGHPDRLFLAALAGSLVAYAAWSVAAPEILDFRMAPLWGLLLGVSTRAVGHPGEASGRL